MRTMASASAAPYSYDACASLNENGMRRHRPHRPARTFQSPRGSAQPGHAPMSALSDGVHSTQKIVPSPTPRSHAAQRAGHNS